MSSGVYRTIKQPSQGIYKEKGSKFLAFAYPVADENEVKLHLQSLRKEYFDARHHVYAFRLGADKKIFRCSDDGEPANSSGPPVLGQIQSFDLTNILIVVVRYFGGTKLGVSGLINAYRTAAADALNNAEIITVTETATLSLRFSYALLGDVMRLVKDEHLEIVDQQMFSDCQLVIKIPIPEYQRIYTRISNIYGITLEENRT